MPGIGVARSQAYDAGEFRHCRREPVMNVASLRPVLRRLGRFSRWRWRWKMPWFQGLGDATVLILAKNGENGRKRLGVQSRNILGAQSRDVEAVEAAALGPHRGQGADVAGRREGLGEAGQFDRLDRHTLHT